MDNKVYVMNDKRYKQIEIECSRMAQERTVFFLVPEAEETKYKLYLEDILYADFTIEQILEDAKENGMDLFYMCTMYDDRVESEIIRHQRKIVSAFSIAQKEVRMPYMKYGDWYLPNCPIRFPTESEALEYMFNRE